MLVSHRLNRLIRRGSLRVIDAGGKDHLFEGTDGPAVTVRLDDRALHHRLLFNPPLALGEGYMDGTVTVEDGDIYDLLALLGLNMEILGRSTFGGVFGWLSRALRRVQQFNPTPWARAHVAHHYDLSESLYRLFLDADMQYSCAYFSDPAMGLDEAQEEKKRHIASKLLIRPGHRVLDIGCGWGGLALYLARETGADVTGLTLSTEQLKVARQRARDAGLESQVRFFLRDYREETGTYDRIVSVGMFEHVGIDHYRQYFAQVRDRMVDDGVALLHTIGRIDGPGATDPWIRKYIFPGGYIPALSEVMPAIEKTRLLTADIEVLRLHYAETIHHWRRRFQANRDKAAALYDERFCRMWEYYLAVSEVTFRNLATAVFQIQLAKRHGAVPLTRAYMDEAERRLAHHDSSRAA